MILDSGLFFPGGTLYIWRKSWRMSPVAGFCHLTRLLETTAFSPRFFRKSASQYDPLEVSKSVWPPSVVFPLHFQTNATVDAECVQWEFGVTTSAQRVSPSRRFPIFRMSPLRQSRDNNANRTHQNVSDLG